MKKNLEKLQQVISNCIDYVGQANYQSREDHAQRVAEQAIKDYSEGKEPKWFEES